MAWEIFKFSGSEQLRWHFGEFIWFLTHFSGKQTLLALLALVGWLVSLVVFLFVCLLVGFFVSPFFFIWDVWISPLVVRKSLHCSTFICMYIWITSPQGQRIVFYISVQSEIILLVNINAGFIHPYFTLPSPGNDSTDIHSREVWGCLAPRRDWDISPKVQPLPNYLLM